VITVGPTRTADQTRLDLAAANAGIIAGAVRELDRVCPDAVVILVSNPVDVLTRVAIETSARPSRLIFGCGTVLDGARLRHQLGKLLGVDQDSVHAYVIGEHGDSSFPVWSSVTVGAIMLEHYGLPDGISLPMIQNDLAAAVRDRGRSIHERKRPNGSRRTAHTDRAARHPTEFRWLGGVITEPASGQRYDAGPIRSHLLPAMSRNTATRP
jgi:L-lactate dehydrogenase